MNTILRESVTSSRIASIGYDSETLTLEVAFQPNRDGEAAVWAYALVGPQVVEHLRTAASIGREFSIVTNNYVGCRVATIDAAGVEHRLDDVTA